MAALSSQMERNYIPKLGSAAGRVIDFKRTRLPSNRPSWNKRRLPIKYEVVFQVPHLRDKHG